MARKKEEGRKAAKKGAETLNSSSPPPSTSATAASATAAAAAETGEGELYLASNDEHYTRFKAQLSPLGLALKEIPGDGNCLFRALGDQLEGTSAHHFKHRMNTVRYIIEHRPDFEPFITSEAGSFEAYCDALARPGTYAGQESLVAFARMANVNIVIHQLGLALWHIHGSGPQNGPELHLSYHNGEHYSSVRRLGDHGGTPANIRLNLKSPASSSSNASATAASSTQPSSQATLLRFSPSTKALPSQPPPPVDVDVDPSWATLDSATEGDSALEDSGGEALQTKEEEVVVDNLESLVAYVMEASSCMDGNLARDCLLQHQLNPELAIDYLINLALLTAAPPHPPTSSPPPLRGRKKTMGSTATKLAAKSPHQHLSNRERKEENRRLRVAGTGPQTATTTPANPSQASLPAAFHCLNL